MLIEQEWEILHALLLQESALKPPVSWPFFSKTSFFGAEREPKSLISLKVEKSCLFLSLFEALFEGGVNGRCLRPGGSEYEQKYPLLSE